MLLLSFVGLSLKVSEIKVFIRTKRREEGYIDWDIDLNHECTYFVKFEIYGIAKTLKKSSL